MMNLNLKLQSSVLKGQVKTIELDLRKLDASQAVERLSIIRVSTASVDRQVLRADELSPVRTALYPAVLL